MEKNFCFNFPVTPSDYFFAYNIWGGGGLSYQFIGILQARVQGGAQGAWPPPLEIEKAQKNVIRANIKLFRLYFATFLVENVIFSASFWAEPPLKNWNEKQKKKKKRFLILGPPLANSWTRACTMLIVVGGSLSDQFLASAIVQKIF